MATSKHRQRKRTYRAPGGLGPVNESPVEGRDENGRMNDRKGSTGYTSSPQYNYRGVSESPLDPVRRVGDE